MPQSSSSTASLPIDFSRRRELTRDLAISFLMQQAVENPQVISLAAGLVDPTTLPVSEVREALESMLSSESAGQAALQYGTTAGYASLRRQLIQHFAELEGREVADLHVGMDRLLVTTGSQQLLSLTCEVLFDPGDICLVAGPTYFVFAGNLAGVGARTCSVSADEHGMQPEALERQLQQLEADGELHRVKLIYVVSYYDNPGGTCITAERRQRIVELAKEYSRKHRILILEDAAYRELRYDGEAFPSLWSFDPDGDRVIYTQTFSKTFSPGVRVGYGIVPQDLVRPLCDRKGNEDFGSSNFGQHLIDFVLRSGQYRKHLEKVRTGYRTKRDAMVMAARHDFSQIPGVSWHEPRGGLYVWMSLPPSIPTSFESALFRAAVQEGVMYVPGELCYGGPVETRPRNQMRLSFGVQDPAGIDLGMQRLANAVLKVMDQTNLA